MTTPFFEKLVQQLKTRLNESLPGQEAHLQMAPPNRTKAAYRDVYKPNETTRTCAVLILLYLYENSIHFPMIVRPENTGVHSGQVAFPGGKKDETDKDLTETALRETWEEVGVEIDRGEVIGQLSSLYIPPSNFLVYPVIAAISDKPSFKPSKQEVAELLQVDMLDFKENGKREMGEVKSRSNKIQTPYYPLQGKSVWGATAMMLSEFLQILEEVTLLKKG